jgi:RNA polymerase sigma-70 factor, ECF subfamily
MTGSGGNEVRVAFDAALLDARAGGTSGLTVLFREHHPRLIRYLRAQEPRAADDLAAETWLAVAAQIGRFEGDSTAFTSWLFSIARRRLADHRRTAARRRTSPVDDAAVFDRRSDPRPIDESVIAAMSSQAAVDLVTAALGRDQADVVLLRTLGGLPAAEIAAVMGRSENWVRVTHHRAMHRLQQLWAERSSAEV